MRSINIADGGGSRVKMPRSIIPRMSDLRDPSRSSCNCRLGGRNSEIIMERRTRLPTPEVFWKAGALLNGTKLNINDPAAKLARAPQHANGFGVNAARVV